MIRQIVLLLAIVSIGSSMMVQQNAEAETTQNIENSLEIVYSCGIDDLVKLNFEDSEANDTVTAVDTLDLTNTGSVTGYVDVFGTNWIGINQQGDEVLAMYGYQTAFATSDQGTNGDGTGVDFGDMTLLNSTTTEIPMGTIQGKSTNQTNWQVQTFLHDDQQDFIGIMKQTIHFEIEC